MRKHDRSSDDPSRTSSMKDLAAAIDVGTNTVLLLIGANCGEGLFDVVLDRCETPRLGAGLARLGQLDPQSVERTLAVLASFAERLRALHVARTRIRVVGTAVLRRARDAAAFVDLVHARCGLSIEVLSGDEEARLAHLGATTGGVRLPRIVIDVGGGSTEIVCDAGLRLFSAPIGAVVLTETYLAQPPLELGGFSGLLEAVRVACTNFPAGIAVPADEDKEARGVLAVGGTALNLACLAHGFAQFDACAAERSLVEARDATHWAARLAATSSEDRLALPIESSRADILPAGLACLAGVLDRIAAPRIRVSGRGLRHGVVREFFSRSDR